MSLFVLLKSFFTACLFTFLVWCVLFVMSGLPGHFDPRNLCDGKGPPITTQVYACIASEGALKICQVSCDLGTFAQNRATFVIPFFLFETLFGNIQTISGRILISVFAGTFLPAVYFFRCAKNKP